MESKENHALSLMIKFSLFKDECFHVLKNHFGEACYNAAITNYKSNYKRDVHRYVAIAHIYHSLINCSSLFDMNVRLYLRKQITVRDEQLKKFSMAMLESYVQQLFIKYAKLCEAFMNIISDEGKDSTSHRDKTGLFTITSKSIACLNFLSNCLVLNATLSDMIEAPELGNFLPGNIMLASNPPVASSAA
ncbi:hypothetical protein L2C17_004719 [Salmonella enterica subsp. enterica serovar Sandiego]|nr:hypothetical protein [Salmonella enterica subsp. enterica serovar Sandiego]EIT4523902.1 hypothetical protein [Salmonella enterica subsp. enterica serovar Sandiego]